MLLFLYNTCSASFHYVLACDNRLWDGIAGRSLWYAVTNALIYQLALSYAKKPQEGAISSAVAISISTAHQELWLSQINKIPSLGPRYQSTHKQYTILQKPS